MIKFMAGLVLGLSITAVIAQGEIPGIKPVTIDCGPTNKATMSVDQGVINIRPGSP